MEGKTKGLVGHRLTTLLVRHLQPVAAVVPNSNSLHVVTTDATTTLHPQAQNAIKHAKEKTKTL